MSNDLVPIEVIEKRIFVIRGQKVMLDSDLADLYGVKTFVLNQAVKRNLTRFPLDFMFQLTVQETNNLKSQFVISSWGGRRTCPFAFTEHGVAMLSAVLNSDIAVNMSIFIIKAFIALRKHISENSEIINKINKLETRVLKHDADIRNMVKEIRKLVIEKGRKLEKIGFVK